MTRSSWYRLPMAGLLAFLALVVSGCGTPPAPPPLPSYERPETLVTLAPSPAPSPTPVLVHAKAGTLPAIILGKMARMDIHNVSLTWECEGGRPWQPGDLWMIVLASFSRLPDSHRDILFLAGQVEIRDLYDRVYPFHWEGFAKCGVEEPSGPTILTRETSALHMTLVFPIPSSIIEAGAPVHLRWDAIAADVSSIERLEIEFVPPLPPPKPSPAPSLGE